MENSSVIWNKRAQHGESHKVLEQHGTLRFTGIAQLVGGVSQRMLTKTLRTMESDGFVT
jgi:DNA-binding HxlR family transcriptional regulator